MTKGVHPHLRLVVDNDPRRYAQSIAGQSSSQRTLPPDSLSIEMAKASEQGRDPYATFLRCPPVVPHRSANKSRSATGKVLRKALRSMPDYHHAVIENATPNGDFTNWCLSGDNGSMENRLIHVRRANLAKLIKRDFGSNASEIARVHDPRNPKPSYFSDLLRPNSGKSFGEKAARKIEERAGLLPGQLDLPDSPLIRDETVRSRVKEELRYAIEDLSKEEQHELLMAARRIQGRRRKSA